MKEVDSSNFEKEVLTNSKPVVVDFWARWCQPCLRFGQVFEKASKEFPQAVFVKVNVDENAKLASDQGVRSIPTVKIFKGGKIVGELLGSSEEAFFNKLKEILK